MTEPHRCPQCNTALIDNAPSGLCPNCLLKLALDSANDTLGLSLNNRKPLLSSDSLSLPAGSGTIHFNDYELTQEIARGGMGVVFKARQISLNRTVALKMMRPGLLATDEEIRRFRAEAEAAARLKHSNIVSIHEVGEQDGLHFFSMDYIEGQSLADLLAENTLEATRATRYVKAIAEAVHYAHEQGILHRDLKPSNILIDKLDRPHVTDFGLAKRMGGDSGMTATGTVLGTPSYMPPEQAEGKIDQMSAASDVYSMGAMLYEMLTGRPPHQAATAVETIMLVMKQEPIAPRLLNPKTDRDLETICLKSLEKSASKRYPSAKEMAEDLGRHLNREPIKARRINAAARALRWCRRNVWVTAAAAAMILLAITAALSAFAFRQRLWRSLVEQARLERFAGNRAKSMEKITEAARIKSSKELRQEAIQTITSPGLRLLYQFPYGNSSLPVFSHDSKMLAGSGPFVTGKTHANEPPLEMKRLRIWDLSTGRPLNDTVCDNESFVFSPNAPLLALSRPTDDLLKDNYRTSSVETKSLSVSLLDPRSGKEDVKFGLPAHYGNYDYNRDAFFSPDGKYYVRGRCLIDLHSGEKRPVLLQAKPLSFISNDELLLGGDGNLECYNVASKERRPCSPTGMEHLALSADGRIAVLKSTDDKTVAEALTVWNTTSNQEAGRIPISEDDKLQVQLSNDGRMLAVRQSDAPNLIQIWEITPFGLNKRIIALGANAIILFDHYSYSLAAFSPDGSLFAAFVSEAGNSGTWIWDTQTCNQVMRLHDNHWPTWSRDGRMLATLVGGTVKLSEEDNFSTSASASISGVQVGISFINVWSVALQTPTYLLPEKPYMLSFTADGAGLASTGTAWEIMKNHNRPQLRPTMKSPQKTNPIVDHSGRLWAAEFDRDRVALRRLYPETGEIVLKHPGFDGLNINFRKIPEEDLVWANAKCLDFSPTGNRLVIAWEIAKGSKSGGHGTDGTGLLELWDPAAQKRLAVWNRDEIEKSNSLHYLKYSPDGKRVAVCYDSNFPAVTIWDAVDGKKLFDLNHERIAAMAIFSRDSKLLFSAGRSFEDKGGIITINDAETGRNIRDWEAHKGNVNALAVSPDGRWLASGGDDKTICIWDAATGKELARWEAHQSEVTALAFSPDGNTLASGGADGVLKLWNIPFIRRELSSLELDW